MSVFDLFDDLSSDIDALVNRRNSIAHGTERAGVKENEYLQWETKTYRVMEEIIRCIYHDVCHEKYLKANQVIADFIQNSLVLTSLRP